MTKETAEQVKHVLAGGGTHTIGALVWWTHHDVHIRRSELVKAMEALGVGAAVPRPPRPATALARAVNDATRRDPELDWHMRRGSKVAAILELRQDAEGRVRKVQVATAELMPVSGTDEVEAVVDEHGYEGTISGNAAAAADSVAMRYQDVLDYADAADVTAMLTALMRGRTQDPLVGGVMLRESGGVYYVPAAKVDVVRQVAAFIEANSHSTFDIWTIGADDENLAQAARHTANSMREQLEEIRGEAQRFVAELKSDTAPSDRAVTTRLGRFQALRSRVELWRDVLGDARDELQGQIGEAQEALEEALDLHAEQLPEPAPKAAAKGSNGAEVSDTKLERLRQLLGLPEGATREDIMMAVGETINDLEVQ